MGLELHEHIVTSRLGFCQSFFMVFLRVPSASHRNVAAAAVDIFVTPILISSIFLMTITSRRS